MRLSSVDAPDVGARNHGAVSPHPVSPHRRTRLLSFPDPVNEVAARLVAGGVVALSVVTLAFRIEWMLWVLAYGFVARVLTGPTLSPLGQLVTRVVVPRLPVAARPVPGPPKRFAQGIGAVFTVSALVLAYGFDRTTAAYVLIAALTVAAGLEAFLGFCLGCKVFAVLIRLGLVPEQVCERCSNIWADRTELTEIRT